jgi:hypothetical protein
MVWWVGVTAHGQVREETTAAGVTYTHVVVVPTFTG